MSTRVGGKFILKDSIDWLEFDIEGLSYELISLAIKYQFGLNLAGNATFQFNDKGYKINRNHLLYDIVDDPISNTSTVLFSGDEYKIFSGRLRIDKGESLHSRMNRIEKFCINVLQLECIDKIILDINTEHEEEFPTVYLKADEFEETLIKIYKENDNWEPITRLIIE